MAECLKDELKKAGCPDAYLDACHAEAMRLGIGHGEIITWILANSGTLWNLFQAISKAFPTPAGGGTTPITPPVIPPTPPAPAPAKAKLLAHGCPENLCDAAHKLSIDFPGVFAWGVQWGPEFWAAFQSLSALLNKSAPALG